MRELPEILRARLEGLEPLGLLRRPEPPRGTDFTSSDYLGFARDGELIRRFTEALPRTPMGSSGSRLLRGDLELFAEVESRLAAFSGAEDALLCPSGYQANLSLFSALLRPGDRVYSDELNHASIIDGIRLSRAEKSVYPHRDLRGLRAQLEQTRGEKGFKLIVSESIFSMEGTLAPIRELGELAREFGAELVIDEAHATGLWRSGWVETLGLRSQVLATVHTGGKSLGAGGAWIAGSARLKAYLMNFARPVIFSTAPLPALAILLRESVAWWEECGPDRSAQALARASFFQAELRDALLPQRRGLFPEAFYPGPIIPVFLGDNPTALRVSRELQQAGLDVRAIRPPTVAPGTARLRVIVGLQAPQAECSRLALAIGQALSPGLPENLEARLA